MDDERKERIKAAAVGEFNRMVETLKAPGLHAERVGRILRAHLLVESCMRRHLAFATPEITDLDDLGLTFDRLRTVVVALKSDGLSWANEPLIALNRIRNKISHRLDAIITVEDVRAMAHFVTDMFSSPLIRQKLDVLLKDPVQAVELFALMLGLLTSAIQATASEIANSETRERAFHEASSKLLDELLDENGGSGVGA